MITKKREMAEWIFDFFRSPKADINGMVMMRAIQKKLIELNPKERDLFVPVANELIENGYFTYEEGPLQSLRLTQKGRNYIYDSSAELDCCHESTLNPTQTQYITNWHNSFVDYIRKLQLLINGLIMNPNITEADKRGLHLCQMLLNGKDVQDIEKSLNEGIVNQGVLDKIEKLNKDLVDVAIEYFHTEAIVKEFWKQLAHIKIERDKQAEADRLNILKINI
jgi:hypothetical protein